MHAAQASGNVSARYDPARLRRPTTPLTGRGCPSDWAVNLSVTAAEPAPDGNSVVAVAPVRDRCGPADRSASLPNAGWLTVHARRHQREVCPLARGVMLQPLSAPLQNGIRFLPPPLPAAPSARLAARVPWAPLVCGAGRTTGLPRSADVPEWLGRISTPVARHLRRGSSGPPDLATYLLVQACQQLALVLV